MSAIMPPLAVGLFLFVVVLAITYLGYDSFDTFKDIRAACSVAFIGMIGELCRRVVSIAKGDG